VSSVYTGAEAAELTVDQAEQSSKAGGKRVTRPNTPESSSNKDIVVPRTPLRVCESQGDISITL
jgi:hypothetical protein